jgi:inositol-phosphate phosphatase / L-galactose 1-phosphate phosphatase / histidinol-phosphatase
MTNEKLFASFIHDMADAAGVIALRYFRHDIPVDDKQDRSPVTQADREIELCLRDMIQKTFPNHGIIGEEFGSINENAEYVWVIDPIDGTKSFAMGRPLFGTIIGLLHNKKPVLGIIDQAYTKERWFGVADKLATHNGNPIKVASPREFENARLYTGSISMFENDDFEKFLAFERAAKWTQYSCDCYAYGLLAMGWADIVIEQCLKIHDIVGIIPIITGAGGVVCDWSGNSLSGVIEKNFKGQFIAASSQSLVDEVLHRFLSTPKTIKS